MNDESVNHSEKNLTYDNKNNGFFDILKIAKSYSESYVKLIGVVLTISGIIVKGISVLVNAGYNNYFSINSSYSYMSEINFFSNLFDILFLSIILLVLNFLVAYTIIKAQNKRKLIRNIFCIYLLSLISIFSIAFVILDYSIDSIWKDITGFNNLKNLLSLSILSISLFYCGLIIGIFFRKMKCFEKPLD